MVKGKVTYHANIIGRNLRDIREARGWSQAQMAHILDVTAQQVQKYESGKNRIPLEHIHTLKTRLGIEYEDFFRGLGSLQAIHNEPERIKELGVEIKQEIEKIESYNLLKNIKGIITVLSSNFH